MILHKRFWYSIVTLLVAVGVLSIFTQRLRGFKLFTRALRAPDNKEIFFRMVAQDFDQPQYCEGISPYAYQAATLNPRGHQVSYWRSECFYTVAINTGNVELCNKVKPLNTVLLDGSKVSPVGCRENMGKYLRNAGPPLPDERAFVEIMNELGYDESTIRREQQLGDNVTVSAYKYFDYYGNLKYFAEEAKKQDFLRRVNALRITRN